MMRPARTLRATSCCRSSPSRSRGGKPILSDEMLTMIIRFYGNPMQGMMTQFLDQNVQTFVKQQQVWQDQFRDAMANTPLAAMESMMKRNLEAWSKIQGCLHGERNRRRGRTRVTERPDQPGKTDDGMEQLSRDLFEMAQRNQAMFVEMLQSSAGAGAPNLDPLNVSESMSDAAGKLWMDPGQADGSELPAVAAAHAALAECVGTTAPQRKAAGGGGARARRPAIPASRLGPKSAVRFSSSSRTSLRRAGSSKR